MNLLDELPADCGREVFDELLRAPGVRIERIVSRGQVSPPGFWYDQPEREWVLVLRGGAEIEYPDGQRVALAAGDCLDIPARQRHRVAYTQELTVWLAVFFNGG